MMCLSKEVAERPSGAEALARMLDRCDGVGSWSAEDAERWWNTHKSDESLPSSQEKSKNATVDPDALTTI